MRADDSNPTVSFWIDESRVFDGDSGVSHRGRRKAMLFAVLFVVINSIPVICAADRWYEDYERAVELIEGGECSREALQLLGAAVVDKPKPKLNARTIAVKTIDYLPYYQLARAHLACGDIDSARHYIGESRARAVAPADQLDVLEQKLRELDSSTSDSGAPAIDSEELTGLVVEATETIQAAISASERVNRRRQVDWLTGFFAANQERLNEAQSDLTSAQDVLSRGTLERDRAAIVRANETATRALQTFTNLEGEMDRIRPPEPTREPTLAPPSPIPTTVRISSPIPTAMMPTPTPSPIPEPIHVTPPGGRTPPPVVPDSLRRAASDYLTAGYEDVVRELDPSGYLTVRQRAAAFMLRAAAHFAIYCLDGRRDQDRLEQARSDIARSIELDPFLLPDQRFFSPEFVALFSRPD